MAEPTRTKADAIREAEGHRSDVEGQIEALRRGTLHLPPGISATTAGNRLIHQRDRLSRYIDGLRAAAGAES